MFYMCVFFTKPFRCPEKNTETPSTQSLRRGEVKVNASQWISSRVARFFVGFWCVSRRKWMGMDGNGTIMHSYYGSFLYSLRLAPVSCWILYMDLGYFGIFWDIHWTCWEDVLCRTHRGFYLQKWELVQWNSAQRGFQPIDIPRPRLPGA